jgi:predicted secreted protein
MRKFSFFLTRKVSRRVSRKISRVVAGFAFFFALGAGLYAGDVATFVDLGFSEDGRYYSFAQYGVNEDTLYTWADLFIVDVALNDFVPGGRLSYRGNKRIEAGDDGRHDFAALAGGNMKLAEKYGISFTRFGIPLFISRENGHNPAGDNIEFRDFDNDAAYTAIINPTAHGSGDNFRTSFVINVTQWHDAHGYKVGSPDVMRRFVTSYTIKKVFITPERNSMVFVIEQTVQKKKSDAPNIRYMVETIRLNN